MSEFTRVLVKVKKDSTTLPDYLGTFGAEPKICTGFRSTKGAFFIPIDTLVQQGFSLPEEIYNWVGMVTIEDKTCVAFFSKEVEIIVN